MKVRQRFQPDEPVLSRDSSPGLLVQTCPLRSSTMVDNMREAEILNGFFKPQQPAALSLQPQKKSENAGRQRMKSKCSFGEGEEKGHTSSGIHPPCSSLWLAQRLLNQRLFVPEIKAWAGPPGKDAPGTLWFASLTHHTHPDASSGVKVRSARSGDAGGLPVQCVMICFDHIDKRRSKAEGIFSRQNGTLITLVPRWKFSIRKTRLMLICLWLAFNSNLH